MFGSKPNCHETWLQQVCRPVRITIWRSKASIQRMLTLSSQLMPMLILGHMLICTILPSLDQLQQPISCFNSPRVLVRKVPAEGKPVVISNHNVPNRRGPTITDGESQVEGKHQLIIMTGRQWGCLWNWQLVVKAKSWPLGGLSDCVGRKSRSDLWPSVGLRRVYITSLTKMVEDWMVEL